MNAVGFVTASIVGSRRVAIDTALIGGLVGVAGLVVMAAESLVFGADIAPVSLGPGLLLTGMAQGSTTPQLMRFTMSDVHHQQVSRAGAAMATVQQAAGALGVAIIGTIFFWIVDGRDGSAPYVDAFAITALTCLGVLQMAGVLLIWRLRATLDMDGHDRLVTRSASTVPAS